jgi:5-methylcytosine-specific restriction protein A
MPMMPKTHHALGVPTPVDRSRADYQRRGTRQEQGYTNEWLARARDFRQRHPLCAMCARRGKVTPCQCVDHIIPHRGDQVLFWDEDNWQSLCNPCHNGPKRREEEAARRAQTSRAGAAVDRSAGRGGTNWRASGVEARPVAKKHTRELKTGGISRIDGREGL